jgi:hypothetical protein
MKEAKNKQINRNAKDNLQPNLGSPLLRTVPTTVGIVC